MAGALLASALASPSILLAQDNEANRATARALAAEGNAAFKQKDYATAEDRFRRANELIPAPSLALDQARALIELGRLGEAYEHYRQVVAFALPPTAPAVWRQAIKNAEREIKALEPRVAWLTISVRGPKEPSLLLDGRTLPLAVLGAQLAADPGQRHLVVSAEGYVTEETHLDLSAGQQASVELELKAVPKPAPIVVTLPPAPPRVGSDRVKPQDNTRVYLAYGIGAVGMATGAVAGILWLGARSDIVSHCGGLSCRPETPSEQERNVQDKRRYDTLGYVSGIGFGLGLAGAVTGTVLLLTRGSSPAPRATASATPYIEPDSCGLRGTF